MPLRVVPGSNLSDGVTEELRAAIHSGELTPGSRLVERHLAEQMGVSHIPVREALARLADEGLIERLPRRGARVAELTAQDLVEISSIRILLEQYVATRVQDRWDAATESRLRKVTSAMRTAAGRGDRSRLFDLDRKFHEELWILSEHQLLMDLAAQLRGRINAFLRSANSLLGPDEMVGHAVAHIELLDAIASGKAGVAQQAMAEHITTATRRIEAARPSVES